MLIGSQDRIETELLARVAQGETAHAVVDDRYCAGALLAGALAARLKPTMCGS